MNSFSQLLPPSMMSSRSILSSYRRSRRPVINHSFSSPHQTSLVRFPKPALYSAQVRKSPFAAGCLRAAGTRSKCHKTVCHKQTCKRFRLDSLI